MASAFVLKFSWISQGISCLFADSLGNMISSPETIAAAPGWTADAQLRLSAEMLAPVIQKDAAVLLDQASHGVAVSSSRRCTFWNKLGFARPSRHVLPGLILLLSLLPYPQLTS